MRMSLSQYCSDKLHLVVCLITVGGGLGLGLVGCIAIGPPAFSYESQNQGNAMCAGLFEARTLQALNLKMPIRPGAMPTRDMLMIGKAPDAGEALAIGALETAIRNCKDLRQAAGYPTSASEDILEARVSKLRYGLYKGEIPFAVYNYGLAQVLKKHTQFMVQGEQAHSAGRAAGDAAALNMAIGNFSGLGGWSCPSGGSCY